MEGVSCDCVGCNVKDFLPFECDNCGKTFCLEHRSVFAHTCEAVPASNEVGSTAHLPSVQGMFDEVSRRFDNEEKYVPKEHVAVQTSKVQVDSGVTSVALKIDHLHAVAEHSNTKQKNISSTTRNMLIKSRAEGPLNVLAENRHYLAITFTATNQLRYLYFSKHASIGECLQYIASHLPLLAFNTNQPAPSLTLTCQTSTFTWEEINHNNPIYTIDCYSDVEVICKPTSDVVAAQRRLQEQVESTMSTSQSEVTVNIPTFNVNDTVVYTASSGEKQLATIVAIHRDDITPYYTVNLSSTKQDRQTDHLHLQPYLISASDTRATDGIKVSIKKKVVHIAPICTNDSVLVLKKAIEVQTLIPVKRQKLIYKGKVLKDGQTLSSAGIALGNTVTLMSATVA